MAAYVAETRHAKAIIFIEVKALSKRKFYSSQAWKRTSRNYMQSVGGLCECCITKGIVTPAEVVHHKTPLTDENINDFNISLSWDNLQALCRNCHAAAHEEIYRQRSGRRYTIDDNGKVIAIKEK